MANDCGILVSLSAQNPGPDFVFPERRLAFDRQNVHVQIGRSSRNAEKGCIPSRSNGWFDSPVMSRQHAEIVADIDAKSVMVTDIGSLHGTFHNGDKLVKGCPRRLASGDILKFGVEIVRGDVVYPQCSVEVQIEQRSTQASNVFRVPEDSDVEEENSDVEIVPPPGIPSSSSPHATHTMHTSTLSSNVIDLSSEPEEPPSPGNQASQDADGSFEQREEASLEPDFGIVQNHIIGQALAMPPTDDPVPPSSFPTTMASTQPDGQGSSMPVGTPAHDARRLSSESDSYPGEDDYEVDIEDESSYYDESSYDDEVSDSDMEAEDFDLEDEDEEEYTHEVRPDMKQPPSGVEPHERDASENASSDGDSELDEESQLQDGNGETAEPGQSKAPNACSLPAILNPAPSLSHDEAITTPPKTDEKPPRSYPSPDAEHRVASSAADTVLPRPGMPLTGLQTQWSGHRFLFSPLDEQPPLSAVRDQSPELDMTSAYAFNQSKAAAAAAAAARAEAQRAAEKRAAEKRAAEAAAAKKVILEALDAQKTLDASKSQASEPDFQIRGHPVGIKDLVEAERRAFTDEAPKSRKRKAADISSTSPEEETWAETALATASAAEMKDGTKEAPEVSSRQEEPPQAPEPSATPATVPVTTVADPAGTSVAPPVAANDRPFKKLRGAAEAFAYAAIGGAAVGVALVSALIATAPAI